LTMESTRKMTSGMLAMAVTRWRQKVSVPSWAAPRPRTRFKGVTMLRASHQRVARDPDQDREHDGRDNSRPGEDLDADLVEAVSRIPNQVADAAQHVVDQRPGEQEQQHAPDKAAEERIHGRVGVRPDADGHQPPGEEREADGVAEAGDAMRDRHHHR